MPNAPRSVVGSPAYEAATAIDPEPHVLSLTFHPPTFPLNFSRPRATAWSAFRGGAADALNSQYEKRTGQTLGYHMLGHVSIELKSLDADTGNLRYLLTASTDVNGREILDLVAREKVGFGIVSHGTAGRLQTPEEIVRDIDQSAEIGIKAVRLRVLISKAAADRMLAFFEEFDRRRVYEHYSLTAYPLYGDGSGCTGLAVSFLEVAGLLEPGWQQAWRVSLPIPESLFGDPELGTRVPMLCALLGPPTRRWATPDEPHRDIVFYDTTAMFNWVNDLAQAPAESLPPGYSNNDPVTCAISRRLAMPVLTVDRRSVPTPTGPLFRPPPAGYYLCAHARAAGSNLIHSAYASTPSASSNP